MQNVPGYTQIRGTRQDASEGAEGVGQLEGLCLSPVVQIRVVSEDWKKANVVPVFRKEVVGQSDSPQSLGWSNWKPCPVPQRIR